MDWKVFFIDLLQSIGVKLIFAAVLFSIGMWAAKLLPKLIMKTRGYKRLDETLANFIVSFIKIALYAAVFVSVAIILGVPATSFITALASAGVAIGLALQGSLSNFAGGIMILLFKPFKDGDYIEGADVSGTVKSITIFYTMLITPDNKQITVPNGTLSNSSITNYSANDTRRNDLVFSVSYKSDIESVKAILLKAAYDNEKVLKDPAPVAVLSTHGDSALEFTLRVWAKNSDYWDVNFALKERIKQLFDKYEISIPYPQMDVHIDNK